MNRMTIRWRLTIWNSVVLTLLFCVFSVVMLFAVHGHLSYQADQIMMEELKELLEDLRSVDDTTALATQLSRRYAVHAQYHFQVLDSQGRSVFRSRYLTQFSLPSTASPGDMRGHRYEDIMLPVGRFRLLSMPIRNSQSDPLLLQVVTPRTALIQDFRWYLGTLLTSLPMALLVSLLAGYLLARRALQPLEHIADTANRISAENLNQRLEVGNSNDELGRLSTTLNQMFDRLSVSMAQMKQFTSDAAHELRSPIASLRTRAEVALRSTRTLGEYQGVVRETLAEASLMSELVDQLLLLSRHDSGQQTAQFEEIRVDVLWRDVVDRFRAVAEEKELSLKLSDLPAWIMRGDDVWLSQLFWNLLYNARKYTLRGGEILVSARIVGQEWLCTVQDTGIGIEARHLPRIFDRFYRVGTSRARTEGGTGLGLAICKSIAEAHGGRILVSSEMGVGTSFLVALPGQPPEADGDSMDDESWVSKETGTP